MKYKVCILEDANLFHKFCKSLDSQIGCRRAHGTSEDPYIGCKVCPAALMDRTCFRMNHKGMTISQAVKASVRDPISHEAGKEIIAGLCQPKEDYPELKPNEIAAHYTRTTEDRNDPEDD